MPEAATTRKPPTKLLTACHAKHCRSFICNKAFNSRLPLSNVIYETHARCTQCRVYHKREDLLPGRLCPCCHVKVRNKPYSRKGKEKYAKRKAQELKDKLDMAMMNASLMWQ